MKTEHNGFALLSAWIAGLAVCAVFALIICFALPVVFSAHGELVFSWVWRPDTHEFGILPMIVGSVLLSLSALLLSWPLSIGVACAIQDDFSGTLGRTRRGLAGVVRFMTAIPTVVYGFSAIFLLVPVVREAAGRGSGLCWLSAALILALLVLPTMVLVMDAALRSRAAQVRITAAALGFSSWQTLACLVLPGCRRWLLTAGVLGLGRAVGDTLIPLMLTGNAPHVPTSLLDSLRTLTAHMGLVTATDVGGPAYNSLFVAGGLLLLVSSGVSVSLRMLSREKDKPLALPSFWLHHAPGILRWLALTSGILVVASMLLLFGFLLYRGIPTLGPSLFFGDTPPWRALLGLLPVWEGIWPACVGTLCLIGVTMLLVLGPGIGCGIFLAEYASVSTRRLLGAMMDILAGIPSIVMGIFGFTLILFLRRLGLDAGPGILLAGGCLALLVLPTLVVTTRTALESLPFSLRLTGFALGLGRGQVVRHLLVPQASRGILGGIMLGMGRAAEDTAVILLTGVVANAGLPAGLSVRFEALPFFIYYTAAQYQTPEELERGFGGSLILLLLSGGLLLAAWWLHGRYQRRFGSEVTTQGGSL